MNDFSFGERSGVDLRAASNGVWISGWYDSMVGIEGGFISWEQLDKLRKKTRRRLPFEAARC